MLYQHMLMEPSGLNPEELFQRQLTFMSKRAKLSLTHHTLSSRLTLTMRVSCNFPL